MSGDLTRRRFLLNSSLAGLGSLAFVKDLPAPAPMPRKRVTLRYDYKGSEPTSVPQLDDAGIDEALGVLAVNGIVRPVARLRPFAVLN